jgi:hypothetical protein
MPSRRFTPCTRVSPIFACGFCSPACAEAVAEGLVGGTFSLSGENPVFGGGGDVSENLVAGKILEYGATTSVGSKCELLKDLTCLSSDGTVSRDCGVG